MQANINLSLQRGVKRLVSLEVTCISHLYDVLQIGTDSRAGLPPSLQVVQEGGNMFVVHTPQMLQYGTSTGRDRAQQPYSTAGVFPDTELPALDGVNATDKGLDFLREFLCTRGNTDRMSVKV